LSAEGATASGQEAEDTALAHARELLAQVPLIDGHNDLPWTIRENPKAPGDVIAYDLRRRTPGDTDLPRLKKGMVGGQFWSVYIPGELEGGFAKTQLEQIDIAHRIIEQYPDSLALALTADDVEAAFKAGKIASLIGMEGGHAIENSLGLLRCYYRLGVRYMTLTHNVTLDWADAAQDEARHKGLTRFGQEVVLEMNRMGMLVDLSHVSPETMDDALNISKAPVIFSHSCARALVNHPRNIPDLVLKQLAANGGVAMVAFISIFVSPEAAEWEKPLRQQLKGISGDAEFRRIIAAYSAEHPPPIATLSMVADHIDHIRNVAGPDHVGLGSDYWGGGDNPQGLEDVSRFAYLFAELIRRGWQDEDLKKLAGGNILRVMREAEAVAAELSKVVPPSSKTIEKMDIRK